MWQKLEIVNLFFCLSLSSYRTIRLFSLLTFPLSVGGMFFRFAIFFLVLPPITYYLIILSLCCLLNSILISFRFSFVLLQDHSPIFYSSFSVFQFFLLFTFLIERRRSGLVKFPLRVVCYSVCFSSCQFYMPVITSVLDVLPLLSCQKRCGSLLQHILRTQI